MTTLTHTFLASPPPTPVALAGPSPREPWAPAPESNPTTTLAERRVR
jgi:hypothetical protein